MGGVTSAKKKFKHFQIDFFFEDFFACNLTLSDFCLRDDPLGFEDCRLATHLLNSDNRARGDRCAKRQNIDKHRVCSDEG